MCWLNLCINLTRLKNVQIADKTLVLDVSVSVFLEDSSIYSVDWIKCLPSTKVGIIQSFEDSNGTKRQRKGKFVFFFLSWDTHLPLPLGISSLGSQDFYFRLGVTLSPPSPATPGSQVLGLRLNYTTGLHGSSPLSYEAYFIFFP